MQRGTFLRNPRASTSDLLTWPETALPPPEPSAASSHRSCQPSDKIAVILCAGRGTDEESEGVVKKKTCSGHKMKEMSGSGIFSANAEDTASQANSANSKNRTSIRTYQQAKNGISQISLGTEESISPKKPTSIPEVEKQRELSRTLHKQDTKSNKQISSGKTKEFGGNDIFGPPPEIVPPPLAAARSLESKESKDMGKPDPRNLRRSGKVSDPAGGQSNILSGEESVKTSKKTHHQKFAERTGNNIFMGDFPPGSAEKPIMSRAKLREITGSDIFADGTAENRNSILGARRPPGGGSSISLV